MFSLSSEYSGLLNARENTWGIELLGENISTDSASMHSVMRRIVIEYLLATPLWIKTLITLTITACLLKPDQLIHFVVLLVIFSFSIELAFGRLTVYSASIIWAKFHNVENITSDEGLVTFNRFLPFRYVTSKCLFIKTVFGVLNIWLIMRTQHETFWSNLFSALVIYLGAMGLLNMLSNKLHDWHKRVFAEETKLREQFLLQEFDIDWKQSIPENNHSSLSAKRTFQINLGHVFMFLFLIVLILIKCILNTNLAFNIYYIFIIYGLLLLSFFSKSRNILENDDYLRTPFSCYGSKILSFHILHSILLESFWIIFSTYVLFGLTKKLWIDFAAIPVIVLMGRFILGNGTILLAKRILNQRFSILIFRRFSEDFAKLNKTVIYPVLGAYGNLLSVNDHFLFKAAQGMNGDSESILNEQRSLQYLADNNWQQTVDSFLKQADVVVFQWNELPTTNMQWEFIKASEKFPPSRIIFICDDEKLELIKEYLRGFLKTNTSQFYFIAMHGDISYIDLSPAIYKVFKSLQKETRLMGDQMSTHLST